MDNLKALYPDEYLSAYSAIMISGPDAKTFLQGQLSCNLDELNDENAVGGLYCNRQGRIICNFYLMKQPNDAYLMIVHGSLVDKTIETLKHYGLFSKVEFAHKEWRIGYQLNQNQSVNHLKMTDETEKTTLYTHAFKITIHKQDKPLDENQELFETWCISNNIPTIKQDNSESFLPHRLQFHETDFISFNKGCYIGQEIIARMHYKSEHKHRLYYVRSDCKIDTLKAGAKLKTAEHNSALDVVNVARFKNKTHLLVSAERAITKEATAKFGDIIIEITWMNDD